MGLIGATLLALVGTAALVAFVTNAEARALEGEELVEVIVVVEPIPAGTPGDAVEPLVVVETVPVKVRAASAVRSLEELAGLVASVDLEPGEQLLAGRFVEISALAERAVGVQVPDNQIEITLELAPERAVGGLLEPGQTVAVFASFEPFDLASMVVGVDGQEVALPQAVADEIDAATPNTTEAIIRKAIVTAVQEKALSGPTADQEVDRLSIAPADTVLITLAVTPFDAERLIFTKEFGSVWLAIERDVVPENKDPVKTRGNVYDDGTRAR